ncbi:cyclomaltodextrinase C-terminal domain-containing protein [Mucilaginibacter mali]|uniref:Cyclomaltodextrinase C-terminal domain-containing protein n=1 Tax=Mucilaginibacter mali TaxID=2740462 RepID=A0A7D4Q2G4_9SPHI|nr:alpha-amylase family glycosyl hydrolase [Mucilaginibacter mali]QKJ29647.1 cyclomaltodextrinase C-terminal domain-containing protein [Mucilaginibacter mali]
MTPTLPDHKLVIYQMLPRLFGNTNSRNKPYGSIEENGVGKFNDINDKALQEIRLMGFTHVWYTGVIEHATMTDYSAAGIPNDDPDVIKGRAGSPYAIKDYYDVDPDLAVDVKNRMAEYEALIKRTHDNGLLMLMDFVPNHVARTYQSDAKPSGVMDFGEDDDNRKAFDPQNDFYYITGQAFEVPQGYNPGGDEFQHPLKDGKFIEIPAKATGNDVFSATPSINDWFETVKLNYGRDYLDGWKTYFDPPPSVWNKMYDILHYWVAKGVDGFRCDMVEHVPMEFWGWVIGRLKNEFPQLVFIGEAYDTREYDNYIYNGKFDYLYDKTGLYDAIFKLTRNEGTVWDINKVWNYDARGKDDHMLRFMENHDEYRIASDVFAGNPWYAIPGMIVTATLSVGPVMVYAGQEVGEPANDAEGFSGRDGRTTIFDYWGMPVLQKWVNGGKYDGGALDAGASSLRFFYSKLLQAARENEAIRLGDFYELMLANQQNSGFDEKVYAYLRYTVKQRILVVVNFNRDQRQLNVKLPDDLRERLNIKGQTEFTDVLSEVKFTSNDMTNGLDITLPATGGVMLSF